MSSTSTRRRVAVLATNGVEQAEIIRPIEALRTAGAEVVVVSLEPGSIQAMQQDVNPAETIEVDQTVSDASPEAFDALVLPGGTTNPDKLRLDADAVAFARHFAQAGKPIAAICHGPWTLIEAQAVRGRTLTSWPSLQTDLRNAGATWTDEEVVVDGNLVTSRKPDDLPAFCKAMLTAFGLDPAQ